MDLCTVLVPSSHVAPGFASWFCVQLGIKQIQFNQMTSGKGIDKNLDIWCLGFEAGKMNREPGLHQQKMDIPKSEFHGTPAAYFSMIHWNSEGFKASNEGRKPQ